MAGRALVIALTLLSEQSLASPVLSHHSFGQPGQRTLGKLPAFSSIRGWFHSHDDESLVPRQVPDDMGWHATCNARAQMFASFAQSNQSSLVAISIVIMLVNIPLTIVLFLLARRLGRSGPPTPLPSSEPTAEEIRLAAVGRNAFAEEKLKAIEREKAAAAEKQSKPSYRLHQMKRLGLFVALSVLYVCSWGCVVVAPFAMEGMTVCNVERAPSTSMLAGFWAIYTIFDVFFLVASTCYLLAAVRSALPRQGKKTPGMTMTTAASACEEKRGARAWPKARSVPATPESQRQLLGPSRGGRKLQKRPSAQTLLKTQPSNSTFATMTANSRSTSTLPTLRFDSFNSAELLQDSEPMQRYSTRAVRRSASQDTGVMAHWPYNMVAHSRSRIASRASFGGGKQQQQQQQPTRPASSQYTRNSIDLGRVSEQQPPMPRRAPSPAASSFYGDGAATAAAAAGTRRSVGTARTTTMTTMKDEDTAGQAWREFAERYGY